MVQRKVPRSSAAKGVVMRKVLCGSVKEAVALVMALYIIIVFVILGLVLVALYAAESNAAHQHLISLQALYLAEAGREDALYELDNDVDWSNGTASGDNFYTKNISLTGIEGSFTVLYSNKTVTSIDITCEGNAVSSVVSPWGNVTAKRRVTQHMSQ